VKNDDVMDLIVVFCILFAFMLVLYCFCVATEFSVNKDLYKNRVPISQGPSLRRLSAGMQPLARGPEVGNRRFTEPPQRTEVTPLG